MRTASDLAQAWRVGMTFVTQTHYGYYKIGMYVTTQGHYITLPGTYQKKEAATEAAKKEDLRR